MIIIHTLFYVLKSPTSTGQGAIDKEYKMLNDPQNRPTFSKKGV